MMLQACVDYMALPQASVSSERRDILHHLVFTSSFPTTITLVDDDEPTGQDFLKDVLVPLLVEDPGLGDRDTYLQFLMQCRSDLLQILPREQQCQVGEDALDEDLSRFECFEESLRQLLKTLLFHQGDQWMQFRSITRDTKPQVLEILIQNEAVHPVETMAEYIDHRLGPTKRVFGLFLGPHQPAVVLHVSLQSDIPAAMSDLLDNDATATDPSVATFYSISNFHAGPFSGIGLGELLIYKVVVKLREELPSLKTFVTLSPMPRFRAWLEDMANNPKNEKSLELVDRLNDEEEWKAFVESCECEPHEGLSHVLYHATANEDWVDPAVMERLLTRLAAYYIAQEKDSFGKPIDGVARFHIANGAQVYRINYGADSSPNGWKNSFGCMVNYLYDLDSLKENQAQYRAEPQNLHVHNNVTSLLL
jgi:malonyl-CoA decarboxylase